MVAKFYAKGVSIHVEQHVWEQGGLPETARSYSNYIKISANSLNDLFNDIASYFEIEKQNISINECKNSIINVSVYEKTDAGGFANKNDIKKWKEGDIVLFLCDYTFKIEKREDVDFSTMSRDDLKTMGVSV